VKPDRESLPTDIRFDGRVAIVTGAGNGLGRDYSLNLAKLGASVVVNDLGGGPYGDGSSSAPADAVVEQIRSDGGKAVASYESVASKKGAKAITETALDTYGRIDILINNAGITRPALFTEVEEEELETMLSIHLHGSFYVGQLCFEAMKKRQYGRILFTSSSGGTAGGLGMATYAAAKAGLIGLMNVVSIEGAPFGILSNAILPGARTRMDAAFAARAANLVSAAPDGKSEDVRAVNEALGQAISVLSKTLVPEFVTPLALFLCSDACQCTHSIFSAIGGCYYQTFLGSTKGWLAPESLPPSLADIASHFGEIQDRHGHMVPANFGEEIISIANARRALNR
jgi:NAD(P)-dependent dehydrogenase (short-subunit alcohol dehydrogenase family)